MTPSQRLTIELSKSRDRLNELAGEEALSEDQRSELDAAELRHRDLEAQLRAAVTAEAEAIAAAPADEALLGLERRAVADGGWIEAVRTGGELAGAAGEYTMEVCGATRMDGGVVVPLFSGLASELRADTTASDVGGPYNLREVLQRVWDMRAAAKLGITPAMVPAGKATWRYVSATAGPAAAQDAEGDDRPDGTTFSVIEREHTAKRAIVTADVTYEAYARHGRAELDAAVTAHFREAILDHIEAMVIAGSGSADQPTGLVNSATVTDAGAVVTFPLAVGMPAKYVDGRYASAESDIRLCIGPKTYETLAAKFATNDDSMCALDKLRERVGDLFVSAKVPAMDATSKNQIGILRRGMASGAARLPMWNAFVMTVDPYTQAGSKVKMTAHTLYDFAVEHDHRDAFELFKFKLAS